MAQQTIGIGAAPNDGNGDDLRVAFDKVIDNFDDIYGGVTRRIPIPQANFGKGATAPVQVILGLYTGWEFDISDDAVFSIDLPDDLDDTENMEVHIHWYCGETYAANSGEVQWQIDWGFTPDDETEAVDAPTHSGSLASGDIDIPAIAKSLIHTTIVITSSDITAKDTLGMKLERIALVGGTDPTLKPTILTMHLEYMSKFSLL